MATDALSGRRILIVEDESLILLTIQDIVEELGCEVAGAAMRAPAAIAILESQDIDAALLDVNLGNGQTSYPVADALAARGVPFAFLTGYGATGLLPAYRVRPVLSKPIDARGLESILRKMMPAVPIGRE